MFPANTHRHNMHGAYEIQILINGQLIAGLRKMTVMQKPIEAMDCRTIRVSTHVR